MGGFDASIRELSVQEVREGQLSQPTFKRKGDVRVAIVSDQLRRNDVEESAGIHVAFQGVTLGSGRLVEKSKKAVSMC